ncbi:uncharacterized protein LOC133877016 [Alnus glutinosa]|uniref:uncharacterized protein LOC133877016 n=1 Tax=Alnus glutinosa TaxID=3517 RepID=UPI002D7870C6|nr:uncharacterized protein LOC133877016 [Alnus glutinosa]
MGKEEKNNKEAANKIPTQNGVIISVYVESPKTQSPQRSTVADVKKTKPKKSVSKKHQAARKRGYDRRAHLLAYARDLRNAGPQEVQRPRNNTRSMPKKKWKWLMKPASFCIQSHQTLERTSSRWRYERMPIEKKTEKVDRSVGSTSKRKPRPTRRSNSDHFFSKLRCMLKELSCKKDDVGKDPKVMIVIKSTSPSDLR